MARGYDKKLYILAFDHRGSFEKMFGVSGRAPTAAETALITDAKGLIFEGFKQAVAAGAPRDAAGVLVDGQYGPDVARAARAEGYLLAMPVEKSGQNEFDFEYGEDSQTGVFQRRDPREGGVGLDLERGACRLLFSFSFDPSSFLLMGAVL